MYGKQSIVTQIYSYLLTWILTCWLQNENSYCKISYFNCQKLYTDHTNVFWLYLLGSFWCEVVWQKSLIKSSSCFKLIIGPLYLIFAICIHLLERCLEGFIMFTGFHGDHLRTNSMNSNPAVTLYPVYLYLIVPSSFSYHLALVILNSFVSKGPALWYLFVFENAWACQRQV